MTHLHSSEALLERLRQVAKRKPTAGELHSQKVSFILSSMKAKSGVTKERVEQILKEKEGL